MIFFVKKKQPRVGGNRILEAKKPIGTWKEWVLLFEGQKHPRGKTGGPIFYKKKKTPTIFFPDGGLIKKQPLEIHPPKRPH